MRHIAFASADDLFKFILARRAAGGRRGSFCETIHFGQADYRLNFEQADWDESGDHFGGKIVGEPAGGQSMTISRLLEHVLLQRVPSHFHEGASSMVLALPVTGQPGAGAAQQILYDAWRQVERADWARSSFYLCKAPAGGGWHAVQVDGVAPGFDFEKFRQANRSKFQAPGLRLFAPAWSSGGCFLFVEWDYRYPRPAEFAQLYRESSGQLILCLAEREAQTREPKRSWWVPGWHVLEGDVYYRVSDLFQVAPPESIRTLRHPAGAPGDLNEVSLPLDVGPVAETVAAARDLELRIGLLKRELEMLGSKRERLQRAAREEFFPVYCWRQDVGDGRLPAGLEHLLGRPLAELSRFLYLQGQDEAGATLHYVAGKDHQTAGLAAAMACDQLYLCDTRWLAWRLPLFVRQGAALSIDVNEEEMAAKILAALPPEPAGGGGGAGEVFCLVEPPVGGVGGPVFTWLTFSTSLDQALAVTNGRAAGPAAAVRAAAYEADGAVWSGDVAVSDAAQRLDADARRRTGDYLREMEDGWENARRDLQAAAFQVRLAELALRPLAQARGALADSWSQFLQRALEADVTAAKFKIEALGQWAASEPARQNLLLQHEQGLIDVEAALKLRRAEYEALLPRIDARNQAVIAQAAQLDQKLQQVRAEETKLSQSIQALARASAELTPQIAALQDKIRAANQETARHTELCRELTDFQLREMDAGQALARSQAELHAALVAFRARLAAARALEGRIAAEFSARDEGVLKSLFRRLVSLFSGGRDGTGKGGRP